MATNPVSDESENSVFPDPLFKVVTRAQAKNLGLVVEDSELQFTTRADLVLSVPPGVNLEGTLFDFFRPWVMLEFKGENDQLTLPKFIINEVRTSIQFLQNKAEDFTEILNLIVSARRPDAFFKLAKANGINFKRNKERPWLWQAQVGFQTVVVVVCRDLPLEQRYYEWLIFSPSDNQKWRQCVRALVKEGNYNLLSIVRQLKPKEYNMISYGEFLELIGPKGSLSPEEQARIAEEQIEGEQFALKTLAQTNLEWLAKVLNVLEPEQRLAGLEPEQRLAGLEPEQRLEGLTPEQRQQLLELLSSQSDQNQG